MQLGLEILDFQRLKGMRIGLLAHPASVNQRLEFILDILIKQGCKPKLLFGAEHGFLGEAQDMEAVSGLLEGPYGIPVVSLYGQTHESLYLQAHFLKDIDVLICDLQDIGCRYYTFAYTVAFALKACASAGILCMVLDRPNPLGGIKVEGNQVRSEFRSFVGEYPLCNRHGMTLGELAFYFKAKERLDVNLEVVWMKGYKRPMTYEQMGLHFVPPSPNMPHLTTAYLYPGLCLIEGTNWSEGRGTTRPFEWIGSPFIKDPHTLVRLIETQKPKGVTLRPCFFKPNFQKHAQKVCGGFQIHITQLEELEPLHLGLCILWAALQTKGFDWRKEPYEFVSDRLAIDLLLGDDVQRKALEAGQTPAEILESFEPDRLAFLKERALYLSNTY